MADFSVVKEPTPLVSDEGGDVEASTSEGSDVVSGVFTGGM